uniref:Uncharacterized protein n=1 Tax=Oryza meridionalis TaxID=40149 RepID=A0A0E0CRX8_9ORYZ
MDDVAAHVSQQIRIIRKSDFSLLWQLEVTRLFKENLHGLIDEIPVVPVEWYNQSSSKIYIVVNFVDYCSRYSVPTINLCTPNRNSFEFESFMLVTTRLARFSDYPLLTQN